MWKRWFAVDEALLHKLLFARARTGAAVDITVEGVSMQPALWEGQVITLRQSPAYAAGDILVYTYKTGELLVHRLLYEKEGRYYCKGDNAFRLEDVAPAQIAGKVIAADGSPLSPCPPRLLILSHLVSRAFFRCRYDPEETRRTPIYQLYAKVILNKGEDIMVYQKNDGLDYIQTDETSLAVYDPESGDTHFFDETGIDILNCLEEPCDVDGLLDKLCQIYDATPEDIREDVEEFLQETVNKRVVKML